VRGHRSAIPPNPNGANIPQTRRGLIFEIVTEFMFNQESAKMKKGLYKTVWLLAGYGYKRGVHYETMIFFYTLCETY